MPKIKIYCYHYYYVFRMNSLAKENSDKITCFLKFYLRRVLDSYL